MAFFFSLASKVMKTFPNKNQLYQFSVSTQGMFCLDNYFFHKESNTRIERVTETAQFVCLCEEI